MKILRIVLYIIIMLLSPFAFYEGYMMSKSMVALIFLVIIGAIWEFGLFLAFSTEIHKKKEDKGPGR